MALVRTFYGGRTSVSLAWQREGAEHITPVNAVGLLRGEVAVDFVDAVEITDGKLVAGAGILTEIVNSGETSAVLVKRSWKAPSNSDTTPDGMLFIREDGLSVEFVLPDS